MKRSALAFASLLALALTTTVGCSDSFADNGGMGGGCTVVDLGDGTSAIRCDDGTEVVVQTGKHGKDGKDGVDGKDGKEAEGQPCTLTDMGDGTQELTCGSISVILGDSCKEGFPTTVVVTNPHEIDGITWAMFKTTNCTWVRGAVVIANYPDAELPKALARIEKVDDALVVQGNRALKSVAFPNLKSVGGFLHFVNNDVLETIGDFPALTSADSIYLDSNPALLGVGSFPKLASVNGDIYIGKNSKLESLPDFASLKTIEGNLWVEFNNKLESIDGLDKVERVYGDVSIIENPKLPQCAADALLAGITIDGYTDTYGNDDAATCP